MGRALIGGLVAGGHDPARIRVADADRDARAQCDREFGVAGYSDNAAAVAGADCVVLAVKPQQLEVVARGLGPGAGGALFLSVAAGITSTNLDAWLGGNRAVVRCMPNTPALIGEGAAALYANARVSEAQRALATNLLEVTGRAWWLSDEAQMDAVTALSGSGPAYFFLFMELLAKIGAELGLEPGLARDLAIETAAGSALLARRSAEAPATLRERVTSPGGTTERALASFAAGKLEALFRDALTAARDRSRELARREDT